MDRFWAKIIKNNRTIESCDVEGLENYSSEKNMKYCLEIICDKYDLSIPIILPKHDREWDEFKKLTFYKEDFIDEIDFDKFEFEIIKEKKKKKF